MAGRNQITKQLLLAATPFPVDSIYIPLLPCRFGSVKKCVGIISFVAWIERESFPFGIVALYYLLVYFTLITTDRELEWFFLFVTLLLSFGSQLWAAQRQGCAIYDGSLKLLVRSLGKPQDRFRRFL